MIGSKEMQKIVSRGITKEYLDWQLSVFRNKVPYMKLDHPATLNDGIIKLDKEELRKYADEYDTSERTSKIKFVPASGAATRMFKDLYEYADSPSDEKAAPGTFIDKFISNIEKFAFFNDLNKCLKDKGLDLKALIKEGDKLL